MSKYIEVNFVTESGIRITADGRDEYIRIYAGAGKASDHIAVYRRNIDGLIEAIRKANYDCPYLEEKQEADDDKR